MKARIHGVASQMKSFDFFFGVSLSELILRHSDNLSRTLQKESISAAEGQEVTSLTVTTLRSLRTDDSWKMFWGKVTRFATDVNVAEPQLPRCRKVPRRFEEGAADTHFFPATAEDHYRQIYFQALDDTTTCISHRFDQPGYQMYRNIQELLLKAARSEDYEAEVKHVTEFYASDLNAYQLKTQLQVFSQTAASKFDKRANIADVIEFFKDLSPAQQEYLSELCILLKLLLVMPASNAASERSFSALRRVKSYLRATVAQSRLNHLMVLHVHKERTADLNLISVANEFIFGSEHRLTVFGSFVPSDLSQ